MTVRVRFAPSPTGTLHIGGARTALFNWLFARHEGGEFFLRIEDTDRERSTSEYEQSILDGMRWLGMDWDGELVYQSKRTDLYKEHVEQLLAEGKAYPCTCTAEELEEKRQKAMAEGKKPKYDGTCRKAPAHPGRPAAIRFRAPQEGQTTFHDICRGSITFDNRELDDLIIARSDGSPTYNFTVVVDDVEMKMTHIIRGDDHINNTPKQVLLYQAMNYPLPEFAHLPMIHGPDGKKLSKRHGATSVIEYQEMGLLSQAVVNYLARLGWAYGDQEIFTRDDLIEKFDLEKVGSSPSIFDMEKLTWVNSQHMAKYSDAELVDLVTPFIEKLGIYVKDKDYASKVMSVERERGKTLREVAEVSAFFFRDDVEIEEKAAAKWLKQDGIDRLRALRDRLAAIDRFDNESLNRLFEDMVQETGLKMLKIAQPARVALTGTTASPGIFDVMTILGRDRVLRRLDAVISKGSSNV